VRTAVLSYRLWQRRFGGDAGIIGRTIVLDRQPVLVTGVMPATFWLPSNQIDLWVRHDADNVQAGRTTVIGELERPGTFEGARAELTIVARRLDEDRPISGVRRGIVLHESAQELLGRSDRAVLALVMLATVCVLVLAAVNVGNLLMVGAIARVQELAIRVALGASRARLVAQLMIEAVPLGMASAIISLVLACWARPVLYAALGGALGVSHPLADLRLLWATVALTTIALVVAAGVPAVAASRIGVSRQLQQGGGQCSPSRGRRRIYRVLVAGQLAVALTLVVTTFSFAMTLRRLYLADVGFVMTGVVMARIDLPDDFDGRGLAVEHLLRRVAGLPGVHAIGASSQAAFSGQGVQTERVELWKDQVTSEAECSISTSVQAISSDYFGALGIHVRGRTPDSTGAGAVVDMPFVERCLGSADPIGYVVRFPSTGERLPIVGVAAGVRNRHPAFDPQPQVYVTYDRRPANAIVIYVRTDSPGTFGERLHQEVRHVDARISAYDSMSMEQARDSLLASPRALVQLLGVLGALALFLAVVGVYGIVSQAVTTRAREVAIRMALGAAPRSATGLVASEAVWLVLFATMLGLCAASGVGLVVTVVVPLVRANDPWTVGGGTAVVVAAGILAGYLPARRMARIDPASLLRSE
jgi:predicted permease